MAMDRGKDRAALEQHILELEAELRALRDRTRLEPDETRYLYATLVQTLREGVWIIDEESRTTFASQRMADILGYAPEEMLGRSMFDFMDDEGRRIAAANVERRKSGIGEAHDFRFKHKNGRAVWAYLLTTPLKAPDGKYAGALGVVADVTERRATESEHARLWTILDRSLNEIYVFDPETLHFEYANEGALRNLGYPLAELQKLTPLDLKPELDQKSLAELIEPVRNGKRDKVIFETVHQRSDGSRYPVEVHLQLVQHGRGSVFVALVNDITDRLQARNELAAREERFRSLIERSSDVIVLLDEAGIMTFASPSFFDTLARPARAVVGRPLAELLHEEDKDLLAGTIDRLLQAPGRVERVVLRVRHQDGHYRYLESINRNLLGLPSVAAIVSNARDVTEQRQLEAQFLQSQKLESVGRLAGGIAHDFNNMLTAILGYTELLERDAATNKDDVREIRRAGERARDLTKQLLAFARRQVISPRSVNLNALVTDTERLISRLLGEDIEISTQLENDLWMVRVDASQIVQVLLNLAVNARDAMPRGGKLTIETANVIIERGRANRHVDVAEGEHVMLVVSDSGSGIPEESLPYVFEPFYTTKASGEGTGLGLATVYGIVKQCGGYIGVYSEEGLGTSFKLYFPRSVSDAAVNETEPAALPSASVGGSEVILVAEDDAMVRDTHRPGTPLGGLLGPRRGNPRDGLEARCRIG